MEQYTSWNQKKQPSALFQAQHQQMPQREQFPKENVMTATADSTSHQVSRYIPKPTVFESTPLLKPLKPTLAHSSRQILRWHPYPLPQLHKLSKSQPTVKSIPSLNVQSECTSHEQVTQKQPKFHYATPQNTSDTSTYPDQQMQIPLTVTRQSKLEQLILSPITSTRPLLLIDEESKIWCNQRKLDSYHSIIAHSFCQSCYKQYFKLLLSVSKNDDPPTRYQRVIEAKMDELSTLLTEELGALSLREAYLVLNTSGYFTLLSTLEAYQKKHDSTFRSSVKYSEKREEIFKNILCQLSVRYQNYIKKEASSAPTESGQRHYCAIILQGLKTKIEQME